MMRFAISAIAVVALALGTSGVAAADDGDDNDDHDGGAVVTTRTVTFTLTSAQCIHLPVNTTINGTGTEISSTTTTTNARGVMTIANTTRTRGTATDGMRHTYTFDYNNSFRISNTVANPNWFSGRMVDLFTLSGNGPARLRNGFTAKLTVNSDFSYAIWKNVRSFGDPISFARGPITSHCDPL